MTEAFRDYLAPTAMIDSDHPKVVQKAREETAGCEGSPEASAVRLYLWVRDRIWYDPYSPFHLPEHYRASNVMARGRGYCVGKAVLLCALGRAVGIPSRLGFATVRNHLATRQLIEFLGSDLFVYHGFTEFHLEGRWVKATPAFNIELCRKHRVEPLAFDGRSDAIFHAYNRENRQFMEYLAFNGSFPDVPLADILSAWRATYGEERVNGWIAAIETQGEIPRRNFDTETVIKL